MGFERRTYRLVWPDDSPWAGFEVSMRPMPIGTLERIGGLYGQAGDDDASKFALLPALAEIVQKGIISWNLTDNGVPVPCDDVAAEGVEIVTAIINAWTEAANQVSTPLPRDSSDGETSPEESMPMVIPSASHPNSNTPN